MSLLANCLVIGMLLVLAAAQRPCCAPIRGSFAYSLQRGSSIGGQIAMTKEYGSVAIDFGLKKLAKTFRNNTSSNMFLHIREYATGKYYKVDLTAATCVVERVTEFLPLQCMPDSARLIGSGLLGNTVLVDEFEYLHVPAPGAITTNYTSVVTRKGCIPVLRTELQTHHDHPYYAMNAIQVANFSSSVSPSVFNPPSYCSGQQ